MIENIKPPRVPAAFINAIADEGTKEEAIKYLQEVWDERCLLKDELAELREKARMLEYVFHYHSEVKPGWIEYGKWLIKLRQMIKRRKMLND